MSLLEVGVKHNSLVADRTVLSLRQSNGLAIVCLLQLVTYVQWRLPSVQHMVNIPGQQLEVAVTTIKAVFMAVLAIRKDLVVIWGNLDLALLRECAVLWETGKNPTSMTAKAVSLLRIN